MDANEIENVMAAFENIHKVLAQKMSVVLKEYNVSQAHTKFMFTIFKINGLNQKSLTEHMGVDKAYTNRVVGDLLDRGLISKNSLSDKARDYELTLTDRGKGILEIFKKNADEQKALALSKLTEEEQKELYRLICKALG